MTHYLRWDDWALAFDDSRGSGPPVILCHALGADRTMWEAQVGLLETERRVIWFDHRGHGESSSPPEPYTMADLGGDVLSIAELLGLDRFDFCGISMGGQVGLWLAVNHPDRVGRMVVANTGARIGTREGWEERISTVREGGMEAIADVVVDRFFSAGWRDTHPDETERARKTLLAADPEGYVGCCAAIREADLSIEVSSIGTPVLVVGGRHDVSTPVALQEELVAAIPGSELVILETAHLASVEDPLAFNTALSHHLTG